LRNPPLSGLLGFVSASSWWAAVIEGMGATRIEPVLTQEVHGFPDDGREMGGELVGNDLTLGMQRVDRISQVRRHPGCDRGSEQVRAARTVDLILVGAIAELAALANEDGTRRTIDGLAVVQSTLLAPTPFWV